MPQPQQREAVPQDNLLRGGEFYSPLQARLCVDDVLLSELRQPCARRMPHHEHELAYVTVLLDGDYLEGDRIFDELHPFNAVFNPAGAAHSTVIGPAGASFFTIEFRGDVLRRLGLRLSGHTTIDRGRGPLLWPGLRLYSAFKSQTADPLTIDSCTFEMLAAIDESRDAEKSPPCWIARVKDRLHEEFRERPRIADLALDAGVHPVHLARVFRKFERSSPGEYHQRLQIQAACRLLRQPGWPLAAIAAECGFSDQSHFTRVFHKLTGATPAKFRQALGQNRRRCRVPSPSSLPKSIGAER